jgi:hypothetical protein
VNSEPDGKTPAERAALACTAGDQARLSQSVTRTDSEAADRRPRIVSWQDAFNLLAYAAAFDGRVRGEHEARAWFDALGPSRFTVEDARAAVAAYFKGPDRHRWITPGDVIEIIEEGL